MKCSPNAATLSKMIDQIKSLQSFMALAVVTLLALHASNHTKPAQEVDAWAKLELSITPSRAKLRQGEPFEAVVKVTNGGAGPVDVSTPFSDIFSMLGVYYRFGEEGKERAVSLGTNETVIGQPPIILPAGASIEREVTIALRSRERSEGRPGAGSYLPVTGEAGAYHFWVGSSFEDLSKVSPTVVVSVVEIEAEFKDAYLEYSNSSNLVQLFRRPNVSVGSLAWAKSFVDKYPNFSHSDLARLQLAKRALSRAGMAPKVRRGAGLTASTEDFLTDAETYLSSIDGDTFPLPRALEAVTAAVKRERL